MADSNLLFTALFNTSLSILRIINAGFTVRDGVSLGQGFVDELGFFGPAIEEAYALESQSALYPRVILGKETGRDLAEWEQSRETHELIRELFTELPRLILQDEDGEYYLNIFYELEKSGVVEYGDGSFTLSDVKNRVLGTIAAEESQHAVDTRITEKLKWMRRFTEQAEAKTKPEATSSFTSIIFDP